METGSVANLAYVEWLGKKEHKVTKPRKFGSENQEQPSENPVVNYQQQLSPQSKILSSPPPAALAAKDNKLDDSTKKRKGDNKDISNKKIKISHGHSNTESTDNDMSLVVATVVFDMVAQTSGDTVDLNSTSSLVPHNNIDDATQEESTVHRHYQYSNIQNRFANLK